MTLVRNCLRWLPVPPKCAFGPEPRSVTAEEERLRLFSYVVASDSGFAPNPFHGVLTLACCKPSIRRVAEKGDIIVGLTPSKFGHRVVFAAKISEKMPFREYWNAPRFRNKRPVRTSEALLALRKGDNIYEALGSGEFRQLPSAHKPKDQKHDLGGAFVLVAEDFTYFGNSAIALPREFSALVVGRGHRSRFPPELIAKVEAWRQTLRKGVRDRPRKWRDHDASWRPRE